MATSKKIDKGYTYQGSYNPGGNQSRDMTLFQDTDGSAYLIYATNNNSALNIDRLSSDYLSDAGTVYTSIHPWKHQACSRPMDATI